MADEPQWDFRDDTIKIWLQDGSAAVRCRITTTGQVKIWVVEPDGQRPFKEITRLIIEEAGGDTALYITVAAGIRLNFAGYLEQLRQEYESIKNETDLQTIIKILAGPDLEY